MKVEEPAVNYDRLMSPQQFLEWDRNQPLKHEYAEGFIIAMQGASKDHEKIVANLIREIGPFLKGKACDIYPSGLRTYVRPKESYFYPDASIVCGGVIDPGDKDDIAENPSVIFEVLSPSTSSFDLGNKFFYYGQIPTLREYITVDSTELFVRISRRQLDNSWKFEEYNEPEQELLIDTIGFALLLEDVYNGVRWQARP